MWIIIALGVAVLVAIFLASNFADEDYWQEGQMKMTLTCCKCGFLKNIDMGEWIANWIDKGEVEFHCGRCHKQGEHSHMVRISSRGLCSECQQG